MNSSLPSRISRTVAASAAHNGVGLKGVSRPASSTVGKSRRRRSDDMNGGLGEGWRLDHAPRSFIVVALALLV